MTDESCEERPSNHGPCEVCGVPIPWGYTCCRIADPCSLSARGIAELPSGRVRLRAETGDDNCEGYATIVQFDFDRAEMANLIPEIVICAAIRLPDGRIFRGHRHGDCIRTAEAVVEWNGGPPNANGVWCASMCRDQGFITSRNRYVDREEGLRLQLAAGIPSACPTGYRARELFSEDLY